MRARIQSPDSFAHEFRLLRNRIEAEIQAPALVFVTSATDGDGAGFAAYGLAESLSKTHQRTVLVTGDPELAAPATVGPIREGRRRRASDRLETDGRQIQGSTFTVVCLSPERVATISRNHVTDMVQDLRSNNDFVVIDASHLAKNGLGLLLVGAADVTIVAFCSGRAQQESDRALLDTLERAEAKVFGVVMTDQETIDNFAQRGAPRVASESAPEPKAAGVFKQVELALSRLARLT